ncbi:MAG: HAD family hydrolase [Candidatus Acetothermia bacterium]
MRKERVVFDLDGVLLDSESDLSWLDRAFRKALKEFGVEPTEDNLKKLYPGEVENLEKGVKNFPATPAEVWDTRDRYYVSEKLEMIEAGELRPFPDVQYLGDLKGKYQLGIISNSPSEVVGSFLEKYELRELFRAWVGRATGLEGLRRIKPHPRPFQELKREMGAGPYTYVGDRESDRKFAERTGMDFLHLTRDDCGFANLKEVVEYLL